MTSSARSGCAAIVGVEADERLAHPRLDHHVTELARDVGVGGIGPARRAQCVAERLAPVGQRILAHQRRWRAAALRDGIEDHLLDGVGFGEHQVILSKNLRASYIDHVSMATFMH